MSLREFFLPTSTGKSKQSKTTMIQAGALGAAMSGSGPTVFGIFSQASQAQEAWAQLREDYDEVFLAEPLVQNSIP
mgnify:CR=1 FL=1